MALVPATIPKPTDPNQISAPTYDPALIKTDPTTDTVEGRISGIIDKNSALMQSAKTAADQQMVSRGLLNSSIGIGAAQKAVIDAAAPIATTDANLSLQTKAANANAVNNAAQLGATGAQTMQQIGSTADVQSRLQAEKGQIDLQLQSADAATKVQLMNRQAEIDTQLQTLRGQQATDLQTLQNQNQVLLQNMAGDQAQKLAQIDNQYRVILQTSQNATAFYQTNSEAIGAILADPKMTPAVKQQQIDKVIEFMNGGLAMIGAFGDVDLSQFFSTGSPSTRVETPINNPAPRPLIIPPR